jgi:hypothetical protein
VALVAHRLLGQVHDPGPIDQVEEDLVAVKDALEVVGLAEPVVAEGVQPVDGVTDRLHLAR